MVIVGLTGGIGSGKSTVLDLFRRKGVAAFVADEVGKELLNSDEELKKEVGRHFGNDAYTNGALNRAYLADIVFKDKDKLELLNSLVHPRVRTAFKGKLAETSSDILIYEAAILFESGSYEHCDRIILVTANEEERIKRVVARDKVSEAKVQSRMKNQTNPDAHVNKVDFIIRNEQLTNLQSQVDTIFELLLKSKNK